MSQATASIANMSRTLYRAAVNAIVQAIQSLNSGAAGPAETYPYMWWADTTSGWLKQRNAGDTAWIKRIPLGTGARLDVASAATLDLDSAAVTSDYIRITGATGITAVTLADGQKRIALAGGAFLLTHGASLILPGAANYTTTAGDLIEFIGEASSVVRVMIWKGDGSAVSGIPSQTGNSGKFLTTNGTVASWAASASGITLSASVATTSGTSIDFTGIPAGVKRISICFNGISTNGASVPIIQIGDSGGIEVSGYLGGCSTSSGAGTSNANYTSGFGLIGAATVSANVLHGDLILKLADASTNSWIASGINSGSNTAFTNMTAGSKSLSPGPIDRVRLTTTGGTDTFDAGTASISWEF